MRPKRVSVGLELVPASARILYQPVGVVGIISPWNYPFNLAIVPLVAALAAGNRVMLKPSELTPRTADFLAELLAGLFPSGQVATVVGGPETGQAFAKLPFDHLLYTGSTAVGRLIMQAAAENLTPVTLELGGKSPCILGEDAALPKAVESIVYGKLLNAGQTCIAPDYVLLPERRLEEFVGLATATVQKFYPTLAGNADYTSIINERHYRRIAQYVAEAKAKGARVVEINPAHDALPAEARKLPPTLVIEPGDDLAIMHEEIFGPVLPIKTYRALDDAIDFVNRRPRPLALYYFGAGHRQTRRSFAQDRLRRRRRQHDVISFRGGELAVRRHRRFGHWCLSRRVWFSDLLAPQGRIPAEPSQRFAPLASAVRALDRSAAENFQSRVRRKVAARPEQPVSPRQDANETACRHCEPSEAIQWHAAASGLLRRGACHRAGHFGPDPLAPRDDVRSRESYTKPVLALIFGRIFSMT